MSEHYLAQDILVYSHILHDFLFENTYKRAWFCKRFENFKSYWYSNVNKIYDSGLTCEIYNQIVLATIFVNSCMSSSFKNYIPSLKAIFIFYLYFHRKYQRIRLLTYATNHYRFNGDTKFNTLAPITNKHWDALGHE